MNTINYNHKYKVTNIKRYKKTSEPISRKCKFSYLHNEESSCNNTVTCCNPNQYHSLLITW